MRRLRWNRLAALLLIAVLLLAMPPVEAGNWMTKGGDPERRSINTDPVGLMQMEEAWRAEMGQSATQPVVLGRNIYHLAGAYLWRIELTADGNPKGMPEALKNQGQKDPETVNTWKTGLTLVSQSTPTYSATSKVIYFGTAFGRLWAYHTERGVFDKVDLEPGCPIVGSPLVLQADYQEYVVVADRPNFPDEIANPEPGRPLCPRDHGKVWLVKGLTQATETATKSSYNAPPSKAAEGGFGGFITPSAVPGPISENGPTFLLGTDGFEGGRAIQLVIDRTKGYGLTYSWAVDGSQGFAGSFVSDGASAYWLDTAGWLWGANLKTGRKPDGWGTYSQNIPALIGASQVFTNTEPVVEKVEGEGTHLYLTLRNYTTPGGPSLRGGETGSDGAVVALGPGGRLKWFHTFGSTERDSAGRTASLNTTPLAITSRNTLLFGDVNGYLYSFALGSGSQAGGHLQPFLVGQGKHEPEARLTLLGEGEAPARGRFNFSQVSGVGVDPVMANGLILVGANYARNGQAGGRLVAYRLGQGYNLRWTDPAPAEPVTLTVGEPQRLANRVALELTDQSLAQLCDATMAVQWYVTGPDGYARKLWPEWALPGELRQGEPREVAVEVSLEPGDPQEGAIIGIIDHPSVLALAGDAPDSQAVQQAQAVGKAVGLAPRLTCQNPARAAEVIRLPGSADYTSGLADNLLAIPYRKRNRIDDPYVLRVGVPKLTPLRYFTANLYLAYVNNTGATEARVWVRAWARSDPNTEAPEGGWREVTLPRSRTGDLVPHWSFDFAEMAVGTWEVIGEVAYEPDTNLTNNRKTAQVIIERPGIIEVPGVGGALTH